MQLCPESSSNARKRERCRSSLSWSPAQPTKTLSAALRRPRSCCAKKHSARSCDSSSTSSLSTKWNSLSVSKLVISPSRACSYCSMHRPYSSLETPLRSWCVRCGRVSGCTRLLALVAAWLLLSVTHALANTHARTRTRTRTQIRTQIRITRTIMSGSAATDDRPSVVLGRIHLTHRFISGTR